MLFFWQKKEKHLISIQKKLKKEIMDKYLNNEGTSNSLSKEYNIPLKNC